MGTGFKSGVGGNQLNFTIVAFATKDDLLAAEPQKPTHGIVTTKKITSWVFSSTEPVSPENGMLWIHTGTYSSAVFNALKRNTLQVYPTFAKQYINNAWTYVTAMTYQNGKWVEWVEDLYLYNEGDTCDSASGGWTYKNMKYGGTVINTKLTFQEKSMHIVGSSGSSMGGCSTANMIDLSKFTKLYAEVLASNQTAATFMSVCSQITDIRANSIASVQLPITEQVISLDISNIKEGYVVFCSDVYSATIKKVWLSA